MPKHCSHESIPDSYGKKQRARPDKEQCFSTLILHFLIDFIQKITLYVIRLLKATCVRRLCIKVGDVNGKHRANATAAEWRHNRQTDRHADTQTHLGSGGLGSPVKRLQHP